MCSFGAECNRRICFFAHAQDQLRVPSEPIVADALAARAPYLQGRVCPKSRYALYPEQVPPAIPIAGVMQPQLLQPDLSGAGPGMPQMMLVHPGDPAGGMGMAAAGLQQQQQWAQGGNMVYVPTGQPGAGAGLGYYMPAGPAAAGMAGGGIMQQQYSAGMALPHGGLQIGGAGQAYSSSQPVQLVTAMGPDGNLAQYPMAAGGMAGAGMAFAPAMYSASVPASLPMPVQQSWTLQQPGGPAGRQHPQPRSQQGQQHLQLMQAPKPAGGLGQAGAQEGFLLAGQSAPGEGAGYTMLAPGATVVNAPAPPGHSPGDTGASHVDDLAQQMGGWRIT